jgi:hypothetical protein
MGVEHIMQGEWRLRDKCKGPGRDARDAGLHNEYEYQVRGVCRGAKAGLVGQKKQFNLSLSLDASCRAQR